MAVVHVRIAALLHSYTGGLKIIDVEASTVGEAIAALEGRFPGIAFRVVDEQGRIRPHMNIFLGEEKVQDIAQSIEARAEIYIVGALSGG